MEQLFANCAADTTPQDIDKSASISRIIYVLKYYSKWLTQQTNENNLLTYQQLVYMNDESATNVIKQKNQEQKSNKNKNNDGIYEWINNLSSTYNLSKLLDDFHYILFFHSLNDNNDDFEDLTKYIQNKLIDTNNIDIDQSIQLIRNTRSRYKYSQNNNLRSSTYCGYIESKEVCCQQILDSIYSFLLFTFDFGYRLTSKQKEILNEIDNELLDKKLKFIQDTVSKNKLYARYSKHKDIEDIKDDKKEEKKEEKKESFKESKLSIFDSGIKFYYWNKEKNTNKWYIKPRYDSFKEEIVLFNTYCTLNNDQWNDILIKSESLLNTNMAKVLRSTSYFSEEYEIKPRSAISIQHILSLLLYSNFRVLRNCLNTTYYADNNKEQDVILRHSEFGYFGRYLRESVECWGWQSDDSDAPSIYYFGFNKISLFKSTIPYIYSPLLTTASLNVALLSKKQNGIIIALRPYQQFLRYFDCSWIADDIGKNEKIFIGGNEPFMIHTIYNIKLSQNYKKYITSIDYFNNMIKAEPYLLDDDQDINDEIISILINLINNKNDANHPFPPYIISLFQCNRMAVKQININTHLMNVEQEEEDTVGYKALKDIFINNDKTNSPNLNNYYEIFPNLEIITIQNDDEEDDTHFSDDDGGSDIRLTMELFNVIIDFYKNNKNTKLKQINIQNPNQNQLKIENSKIEFNQIISNKYNDINLKVDIKKETNTISVISP